MSSISEYTQQHLQHNSLAICISLCSVHQTGPIATSMDRFSDTMYRDSTDVDDECDILD